VNSIHPAHSGTFQKTYVAFFSVYPTTDTNRLVVRLRAVLLSSNAWQVTHETCQQS